METKIDWEAILGVSGSSSGTIADSTGYDSGSIVIGGTTTVYSPTIYPPSVCFIDHIGELYNLGQKIKRASLVSSSFEIYYEIKVHNDPSDSLEYGPSPKLPEIEFIVRASIFGSPPDVIYRHKHILREKVGTIGFEAEIDVICMKIESEFMTAGIAYMIKGITRSEEGIEGVDYGL